MIMALNRDTDTCNWNAATWWALFWNLHCGVRHFFVYGHVDRFNGVVTDFTQGRGPEQSNMPLEMVMAPIQIMPPGSITSDNMSAITDTSNESRKCKA